ncbi:hypothetical protein [Fodinicola acaciae]|uniref:hypothetical protein n=1 Tax=Fodinicola acaciae TaxID=2681555 RepID=UPI0013CFA870|nr:hypothetical protein [Fodinicola acaciae]
MAPTQPRRSNIVRWLAICASIAATGGAALAAGSLFAALPGAFAGRLSAIPPAAWLGAFLLLSIGGCVAVVVVIHKQRTGLRELDEAVHSDYSDYRHAPYGRTETGGDLPARIERSRQQLDHYHDIATHQARASFRSSQTAMGVCFGWMLAWFSAGLIVTDTETRTVLLAMGSVGGTLGFFVHRTYLSVFSQALSQLNHYAAQAADAKRLLDAERLIDRMTATDRGAAYLELFRKLIDQAANVSVPEPRPPIADEPVTMANSDN